MQDLDRENHADHKEEEKNVMDFIDETPNGYRRYENSIDIDNEMEELPSKQSTIDVIVDANRNYDKVC